MASGHPVPDTAEQQGWLSGRWLQWSAWGLWLGRSRLKSSLYLPLLTTAAVVILVKGFVWPDSDTKHPLVDAATMPLGFLIVTRFRLDRLARQTQLQPGAAQDRHRTGLIWAGMAAGVLLNLVWVLVDK